jgi:hypothetical protein
MNSFRTFISCFFLLFSSSFYATDLVVNSSGQSGTYTTLSAALTAAASSGDRILIPSTITLIEDITINKSIDIMPLTADNYFYLEGDINITSNAGLEIRILGMNFSGDLVCSSGTASETNRCHLYFIDCNVTDPGTSELSAEQIGLAFHVLYCYMPDININLKFGEIIASHLNNFRVSYTDNNNYNDTVRIIANIFESQSSNFYTTSSGNYNRVFSIYDNLSHYFLIANNFFKYNIPGFSNGKLTITASNSSSNGNNEIINNTICNSPGTASNTPNGSCLIIDNTSPYPRNNINIFNNIFLSGNYYSTNSYVIGNRANAISSLPFVKYNLFSRSLGVSSFNFTNLNDTWPVQSMDASYASTFLIDANNYIVSSSLYDNTAYIDNNSGKGINGVLSNTGKNESSSYDLDMTRNDLGTYGGPYSMENYWDSTATGKARIYNLDMPFEIWSGQTPTIKASAVHTK